MTSQKTVFITGCSDGGIGSALAAQFQARGWYVFATTRDASKMSLLAQLPSVQLLTLDVTNSSQISEAFKTVEENGNGLDILINNAGRNHFSPVLDINIDEAKKIYDSNLWGPIALIHAFAPLVIKNKGTIVNVTSIAGHINVPHMGLYSSSKISLELISEHLRLELEPFGVNVLSIVTGAVRSQGQTYFEDWKLPEGSIYAPIEDIIANRTRGGDGKPREDTQSYAEKVVNDIVRGASGKVWHGSGAGAIKFMSKWVPQAALDKMTAKDTGLDQLPGKS